MADLSRVFDEVVRSERGRIVGGLLRRGVGLDAAEEAFQEAVLAAMQAWRSELPRNAGAWPMTAAKNSARDAHRHRVARSMRDGPIAGLRALKELEKPLSGHHLFHAARADFLERSSKDPSRDLHQALALATNEGERRLLERRLKDRRTQGR